MEHLVPIFIEQDVPCPACDAVTEPLGALGESVAYRCPECGEDFLVAHPVLAVA